MRWEEGGGRRGKVEGGRRRRSGEGWMGGGEVGGRWGERGGRGICMNCSHESWSVCMGRVSLYYRPVDGSDDVSRAARSSRTGRTGADSTTSRLSSFESRTPRASATHSSSDWSSSYSSGSAKGADNAPAESPPSKESKGSHKTARTEKYGSSGNPATAESAAGNSAKSKMKQPSIYGREQIVQWGIFLWVWIFLFDTSAVWKLWREGGEDDENQA